VVELAGMPYQPNGEKRVYVGQSAKTPSKRFTQHKAGGLLANPDVRKYGRRLLPALYETIRPLANRDEAERAEAALASMLRERGFVVVGKHGKPVEIRRRS
jgi:hypothetical protein